MDTKHSTSPVIIIILAPEEDGAPSPGMPLYYIIPNSSKKLHATHITGEAFVLLHQSLVLLVDLQHLADAVGGSLGLLSTGEGMVVGRHVGHHGALIRLGGVHHI